MAFNDTNGAARLMRYDLTAGGSWQAVRTVDNAGTGVSLRVIGGKLYMACITNRQVGYMYYNDLLLMQVDGTTATDLSTPIKPAPLPATQSGGISAVPACCIAPVTA